MSNNLSPIVWWPSEMLHLWVALCHILCEAPIPVVYEWQVGSWSFISTWWISILSIPTWSMVTKWELTKWEVTSVIFSMHNNRRICSPLDRSHTGNNLEMWRNRTALISIRYAHTLIVFCSYVNVIIGIQNLLLSTVTDGRKHRLNPALWMCIQVKKLPVFLTGPLVQAS